jgi:hypothetical protein
MMNLLAIGRMVTCAATALLLCSGCASLALYQGEQTATARTAAIKLAGSPAGVSVSLNLTAWEYLTQHPWKAIGGALLDAGTATLAWYLYDQAQQADDADPAPQTVINVNAGRDIIIQRDYGQHNQTVTP